MKSLLRTTAEPVWLPAGDAFQQAQRLAEAGDRLGAIRLAAAQLEGREDSAIEKAMIRWRSQAFSQLQQRVPQGVWPTPQEDPFPGATGLAEIAAGSLSSKVLAGAIEHHGSLCVRGLLSGEEAASLREGIDRTFEANAAHYAGTATKADTVWYSPFDWGESSPRGNSRSWAESVGGIWTVDSPRMMRRLIDMFERLGLFDRIAEYFGERPALSIGKSTLRRANLKPSTDAGHGWHQDGAFLGRVRSVNVWIALSDCGEDSPGLDIVARRLGYVVQTGSHGAALDWTVGNGVVGLLERGGATIVSPQFQAGDAMLFDHLMLHRTSAPPGAMRARWAIESWFFAPSAYPMDQGPFVI